MEPGYVIIQLESKALDRLAVDPEQRALAVAVLSWLTGRLQSFLAGRVEDVLVEVIPVCYFGCYPWIGLRCSRGQETDLVPMVEAEGNRLVGSATLVDFVEFVANGRVPWGEVAAKVMAMGKLQP